MSNSQKFEEFQLSWQLTSFGGAEGTANEDLKRLWNHFLGQGGFDSMHFGDLFYYYSKALHMVEVLELKPIADSRKKKLRLLLIGEAMEAKATHNVLYDNRKDQMVAWLKADCEERIKYWENIEETIGRSLNVPNDLMVSGDEHPIHDLLWAREQLGWILIGIRDQQAEDKYVTVDIKSYERRMKIADITLKKLVLFSLWDYYREYHEPTPYAPPDFWWRRVDGHEFQLPEEDWVRKWLDYDRAAQEVKKIEEEEELANLHEAATSK